MARSRSTPRCSRTASSTWPQVWRTLGCRPTAVLQRVHATRMSTVTACMACRLRQQGVELGHARRHSSDRAAHVVLDPRPSDATGGPSGQHVAHDARHSERSWTGSTPTMGLHSTQDLGRGTILVCCIAACDCWRRDVARWGCSLHRLTWITRGVLASLDTVNRHLDSATEMLEVGDMGTNRAHFALWKEPQKHRWSLGPT